jgi:hypothetical protein
MSERPAQSLLLGALILLPVRYVQQKLPTIQSTSKLPTDGVPRMHMVMSTLNSA